MGFVALGLLRRGRPRGSPVRATPRRLHRCIGNGARAFQLVDFKLQRVGGSFWIIADINENDWNKLFNLAGKTRTRLE
jgi:hypothetical protein